MSSAPQEPQPIHDTPILGMTTRPRVQAPVEYGNAASFWVEYPSGLVDLTRSVHLPAQPAQDATPPPLKTTQRDIPTDGERIIRVDTAKSALVVIDMQKFVLRINTSSYQYSTALFLSSLLFLFAYQ